MGEYPIQKKSLRRRKMGRPQANGGPILQSTGFGTGMCLNLSGQALVTDGLEVFPFGHFDNQS